MGNKQAKIQRDDALDARAQAQRNIDNFSYTDPEFRAGLTNPYADAKASTFSNPFAGQQVALQASEYQRQAQDQSQANVLDAIVQGGGNAAASATALARQSAQGNQQIAAGIQQQEAQNNRLLAQGEQQRQQAQAAEQARVQGLIGAGNQFTTQLSEQRAQLEQQGLGNQYAAAQQSLNSAYQNIASNNAAIWGAVGSVAGAAVSAFNPLGKLTGK